MAEIDRLHTEVIKLEAALVERVAECNRLSAECERLREDLEKSDQQLEGVRNQLRMLREECKENDRLRTALVSPSEDPRILEGVLKGAAEEICQLCGVPLKDHCLGVDCPLRTTCHSHP